MRSMVSLGGWSVVLLNQALQVENPFGVQLPKHARPLQRLDLLPVPQGKPGDCLLLCQVSPASGRGSATAPSLPHAV